MKKTRRLAQAFFNRFKKKPLPTGWTTQPKIKSGVTGGFGKYLKKDTSKPAPPAPVKKQEKYKRRRPYYG
jgi:hypothetical protein